MDETKEWWDSLTDEQKYNSYLGMKSANKSHADALHEVTNYLLGKDWYCMAMDIYGANEEIVSAIKYHYRDVNYSWENIWSSIKKALKNYFTNGK